MKYYCCDQRRLEVVKLHGSLNGLEYLEVQDSGIPGDDKRQRTLIVKFLRPVPSSLDKKNCLITGGERIKTVEIEWIAVANALPAGESTDLVGGLIPLNEFLVIRTKYFGDFSQYTFSLVSNPVFINNLNPVDGSGEAIILFSSSVMRSLETILILFRSL